MIDLKDTSRQFHIPQYLIKCMAISYDDTSFVSNLVNIREGIIFIRDILKKDYTRVS